MSYRLGCVYRDRELAAIERSWHDRVRRSGRPGLAAEVAAEAGGLIRVEVRPRPGHRLPVRLFGSLLQQTLGPEREEQAELWLIRPGHAGPGALRLAGASWDECLAAIADPASSQLRLFSPLLCRAEERRQLIARSAAAGLALASAEGWLLLRRRKVRVEPPPPPWRGNFGG